MTPRLSIMALKVAGVVAVAAALVFAVADWRGARAARAELRICTMAAAKPQAALDGCTGKLAAAIIALRQAAACETALGGRDLFAIRSTCGPQVQIRVARQAAAEANLADVRVQLAEATARAIAAVSRAEARATQSTERKARAEATIARAPRDPAGIIVCNAGCLRELAGATPHR